VAVLLLLFSAATSVAFIPKAERIASAIARSNAASGRAQALRIHLEMRIGDGPLLARGELVTHPTGMARLELRGAGNLVEKHLLQGSVHVAGRNGEPVLDPRALLPPLFLLQIDSAVSLRAALHEFRIQADWVGLVPCGERDCYVLGDPDRVPPPLTPPEEVEEGMEGREARAGEFQVGAESGFARESLAEEDAGEAGVVFELEPGELPSTLWADVESFDVRKLRLSGGEQVFLGPYVAFERVRLPSWIEIQEERGRVRFDVVGVTPVNAAASAFGAGWVLAPSTQPPTPSQLPEGPPDRPEEDGQ
jgi:hypothetical protein